MAKKTKITGIISPPVELRLMSLAFQVSFCSKDPVEQVGAVITDKNNYPLSVAWNDKIEGIFDKDLSYEQEEKDIWMNTAVCRAVKFLLHKPTVLYSDYKAYLTHPPCLSSVKLLSDNGVKSIVYGSLVPHWHTEKSFERVKKFCKSTTMTLVEFDGNVNWSRDKWDTFVEENF